jgi:hypothetical protein
MSQLESQPKFPRHLVLGKQFVFEGFSTKRDLFRGGKWLTMTTVFRSSFEVVVCLGAVTKDGFDRNVHRAKLGTVVPGVELADVAVRRFEGPPETFDVLWPEFKQRIADEYGAGERFYWRKYETTDQTAGPADSR